ncbi:hypothetical protein ACWCWD_17130, partial [Streptomyces sp. NPDC001493]
MAQRDCGARRLRGNATAAQRGGGATRRRHNAAAGRSRTRTLTLALRTDVDGAGDVGFDVRVPCPHD